MPPTLVVCHICGREFGHASIDIHVPQCAKKWEAAEAQRTLRERRPVPQRPALPPGASQEKVNDALRQHWNEAALEACPHCGRTFLPERLQVHLRSCRAPSGGGPPRLPASARSPRRPSDPGTGASAGTAEQGRAAAAPAVAAVPAVPAVPSRPQAVVCHICGREFGTASIDIHVPQCARKWEAAEAQKPASQRRLVPQKPELEAGLNREQANGKLLQHWNDEVLQPCPHCGRTFLPERLEVHLRSCRPKTPGHAGSSRSESLGASKGRQRSQTPTRAQCWTGDGKSRGQRLASPKLARPKAVVCHICGREFGTASIEIHVAQCQRKWEAAEAQKPVVQRRPVPQKPELEAGLSPEQVNDKLLQHWNEHVLAACPHCGRTFLPDRLEVHLRSCRPRTPVKPRNRSCGAQERSRAETGPRAFTPEARVVDPSGRTAVSTLKQPPPRPKMVVCHICGREFGTASIDIHVPQCQRKWEASEARKPEAQRRPVPQKPELEPGLTCEEANDKLFQHWNEDVLQACPHCGRTFLPDRLEVHLRSCHPKSPSKAQSKGRAADATLPTSDLGPRSLSESPRKGQASARSPARPRTVVCHICGREFGTASIAVHVPQCERKWHAAEAQKPAAQRQPVPQKPELEPGLSREQANDKLLQHWNEEVLSPCPHCGRTFLPDRLEVHLRSCRPKSPGHLQGQSCAAAARVGEDSAVNASAPALCGPSPGVCKDREGFAATSARPRMVVCHICGREFGTASIDIHVPQCERRWKAAEAQRPAAQRRPVPGKPDLEPGPSQEWANDLLLQHWNDRVLEPCPHCGRTFLPDRLEVHLRSCRPKEPPQ